MNSEEKFEFEKFPLHKKSRKHLRLPISLVILLIFMVILVITTILIFNKKHREGTICLTPACIHTASNVLNYIDDSVNPCDDFYQFACGGYLKNTNLPGDKTEIGSFTTVEDKIQYQIKSIIDEPPELETQKIHDLIKSFYNICMNTTNMETESIPFLLKILKDLGGWPLWEGNNWNEGKFDWKQIAYKLRKLGFPVSIFIEFNIVTDKKNSSRRMINLDESSLGLSKEYLVKGFQSNRVKEYFNYMVDIATFFGLNYSVAFTQLRDTLEFEIALAKLFSSRKDLRNATALYNPMTVEELQETYPFIPWLEYLNNILDIPDIEINEDEVVNVAKPKYLNDLSSLLRKTPKKVQANYIMKKIILSCVYALPEKSRNRQHKFLKVTTGRIQKSAQWEKCTSTISSSLPIAIGSLYIRKYFNENSKREAKEMITNIQSEFIKSLTMNDWMDEDTKYEAIEKALSMFVHVGYADELLDVKLVEKHYLNLDIISDNYLETMLSISLFNRDYIYKQLKDIVNRTDWTTLRFPTVINAYYSFQKNSIEFSAGILQGLFFDSNRPRYMNYGGIGSIIGREITHGFDDQGRQYDKNGNVGEWWTLETKEIFNKRTDCIVDQFKSHIKQVVGFSPDGISTQAENIADNGGIKQAYLAYQTWVNQNGPESLLPGLPYTPNQMFWISAANVWCEKNIKESLKLKISKGSHPPGKYRVLDSFSNLEYFSEDFKCPLGSRMNPKSKCQVW